MIIRNKALLASCRKAGLCDFCRKPCKKREGAHVISRGAGGSDLKCNLVCLGQTVTMQCSCHTRNHNGQSPDRMDLLRIVALREKCSTDDILAVIRFIQLLDKSASKYQITEKLIGLPEPSRTIAKRELVEASKL